MNKSKKQVCIVARCTELEKEIIHRKAVNQNKSDSKYILDACMAGLERKRDKERKRLIDGVEFVELSNEYYRFLRSNKTGIPDDLYKNLEKKFIELEEKSLCLF